MAAGSTISPILIQRRAPGGPLRLLLRLPIVLYRCRLGWMLGRRLIMLTHIGRNSGRRRRTVLEVVRRDDGRGIFIVCSGWGRKAQWLRNIIAEPRVWVTAGAQTLPRQARLLPPEEAETEFRTYASRSPRNVRLFFRLFLDREFSGSDEDFAALSHAVPVVALGPLP